MDHEEMDENIHTEEVQPTEVQTQELQSTQESEPRQSEAQREQEPESIEVETEKQIDAEAPEETDDMGGKSDQKPGDKADEPQTTTADKSQPASQPTSDTQSTTTQNSVAKPPLHPSARYRRLVTSSSTALAHAVKSLTYKRVAACYPSIAKTPAGQEALREALKQICKAWQESVQTEFDAIFDERHLPEKLAQLDQLVKEAKLRMNSNTDLPIHVDKLTPDQIIKSHLRETKLARIKKLKQLKETVKKENEDYRQKIKDNNEKVHASLDKLHKVTSDINKATAAGQEMPERAELYESWKAV